MPGCQSMFLELQVKPEPQLLILGYQETLKICITTNNSSAQSTEERDCVWVLEETS